MVTKLKCKVCDKHRIVTTKKIAFTINICQLEAKHEVKLGRS